MFNLYQQKNLATWLSRLLVLLLLVMSVLGAVPILSVQAGTNQPIQILISQVNEQNHLEIKHNLSVTDYTYGQDTAYDLLKRATTNSYIPLKTETTNYGEMIVAIDGIQTEGTYFWAFYINGKSALCGASGHYVDYGDTLEFRYKSWEDYDPTEEMIACNEQGNGTNPGTGSSGPQQVLEKISQQILEKGIRSEWEAFALGVLGKNVSEAYIGQLLTKIVGQKANDFKQATDYAKAIFTLRALGGDPKNVRGVNLIDKLAQSLATQKADQLGINDLIFSIIALDTDGYNLPNNSKFTKDQLIDLLVAKQNADGGWDWGYSGASSEADLTAMAISALAKYQHKNQVKQATDKALAWLKSQQTASGGYSAWGSESAESVSQVIIALSTLHLDPAYFQQEGGKDAVSNLLSLFSLDRDYANSFKTEQALLALTAYQQFKAGKGSFYDLSSIPKKDFSHIPLGSGSGGGLPEPGELTGEKVYLTVKGLNGSTMVSRTEVSLREGDTPFSVLVHYLGEDQVEWRGSGTSLYVSSIQGLAEFQHGPKSGWMYAVDGVFIQGSVAGYTLIGGEEIIFQYTLNLGADIGAPSGGGNKPATTESLNQDMQKQLEQMERNLPVNNRQALNSNQQTVQVINGQKKMSNVAIQELLRVLSQNNVELSQQITELQEEHILADEAEEVTFVIPAGALSSSQQIQIKELVDFKQKELLSSVYEFLPKGTRFDKPVYLLIKVPLTLDRLEDLAVVWLDEEKGAWVPIPAVVDAEQGLVIAKVDHFTKFAVIDRSKLGLGFQDDRLLKQTKEALSKVPLEAWHSGEYALWELLNLHHLGLFQEKEYLSYLDKVLQENKGNFRRVTDHTSAIIGLYLAGENPHSFAGYNLIESLTNDAKLTRQGNNGVIFALIALEMTQADVSADAKWNSSKLVELLLSVQKADGSWALHDEEMGSVDITAMALGALAYYGELPQVQVAQEKAVKWLASKQGVNGGFAYDSKAPASSESISQVIIGLTASGVNPTASPFQAENNMVDSLLAYQLAGGGFKHFQEDQTLNDMSSQQAVSALLAYQLWKEQGTSLYGLKQVENPAKKQLLFIDEAQIAFWAKQAVEELYEQQIMLGVQDNPPLFAPQAPLTRAQFTTLLVRVLDQESAVQEVRLSSTSEEPSFIDVTVQDWYYAPVMRAKELGYVQGVSSTSFAPNKAITRQEMAIMIDRALQLPTVSRSTKLLDLEQVKESTRQAIANLVDSQIMVGDGQGYFRPQATVSREMGATAISNVLHYVRK